MKSRISILVCLLGILVLSGCVLTAPPSAKIGFNLKTQDMQKIVDGKQVTQRLYVPELTMTQPKDVTIKNLQLLWNLNTGDCNLTFASYESGYSDNYLGIVKENGTIAASITQAAVEGALKGAAAGVK
jgi:hypothetical protein